MIMSIEVLIVFLTNLKRSVQDDMAELMLGKNANDVAIELCQNGFTHHDHLGKYRHRRHHGDKGENSYVF